ncbi:MAG: flavodoxin family protein [Planctomycetia bacterium]|nr:flavodoxin family protein [Planctomycetia bacterium]
MKVILINGSPHPDGCTFTALSEVASTLQKNGIETEFVQIGRKPIAECIACNSCAGTGKCVFSDDQVNDLREKLEAADGLVVGSPVYYANPSAQVLALLTRVFYGCGSRYNGKLGAAVVSARRGGCATSFDAINKFFAINNIHIVASQYWNQVHGSKPDDVRQDLEGMQTMRTLGENMAWLLKCIELGRCNGLPAPQHEPVTRTNFVR